jgi:hypothetical protein
VLLFLVVLRDTRVPLQSKGSETYLTRLGECIIDIEEDNGILDGALVKRWVD